MLLHQLTDFMILILIAAAVIAAANTMKRPPRNPKQSIFAGGMAIHILWVGFLMAAVALAMHSWNSHWQTIVFTVLCFNQMGHVMAIRSERESVFKIGVFSNKPMLLAILLTVALQLMIIYIPFFNDVFRTQPLTFYELGITLAVSNSVFWAVEIEKWIKRRIFNK